MDAQDWWYRSTFAVSTASIGQPGTLCFDGLATLADIWLNGERLLSTDNMFRAYQLDVTSLLRADNELAIRFRSLSADLQQKRPRPRWKTNLVDHQQLRWHRTTLLGHIPGWSPPVPAIGPWRGIRLERQPMRLSDVRLVARLDGTTGVVTFRARVHSAAPINRVFLRVGEHETSVAVKSDPEAQTLSGELRISDPPLWWPHTHGLQPLFACDVLVESGSNRQTIACGKLGFRDLRVEKADGFGIVLNGEPIYCRGACWTVSDIFTLSGTEESLRHDLLLARDAGANLLRVGGTMTYESDLFYRLCKDSSLSASTTLQQH